MDPKLAIAGYACIESILQVSSLPDVGGRVTEDQHQSRPGGRAGNAAIAAARLGVDPLLCATLGDDSDGKRLFNFYAENGVGQYSVKFIPGKRTGKEYLIYETYCDAARRLVYPGAADELMLSQITSALGAFPDGLYLTTELSFDLICQSARQAATKGIPVFLDALPVNSRMQLEQLPPLELFIIDRPGAEIVAKCGKITVENCLRAAVAISKRVEAKYYIIRLLPVRLPVPWIPKAPRWFLPICSPVISAALAPLPLSAPDWPVRTTVSPLLPVSRFRNIAVSMI